MIHIEDYPKWKKENPEAKTVMVDHGKYGKVQLIFNYKNSEDITLIDRMGAYDCFGRFHFIDHEGTMHICYNNVKRN